MSIVRADKLEIKQRGFQAAMNRRISTAEKIRRRIEPIDVSACYSSLAHSHLVIAFYKYFVQQDQVQLKQNLYTACRLELAAIAIDGFQKFTVPTDILYALLSGSSKLIESVTTLEFDYFVDQCQNPRNSEYKVRMWQLAVQRDDEQLEKQVNNLARKGRKYDQLAVNTKEDFFSMLLRGEKAGLEDLIARHASVPEKNALMEYYFSGLATLETKVCWHRGIHVEIDHPLVPMELMKTHPLPQYDDIYDFLAPDWSPPSRGMFGKLFRFFS